VEKLEPPELDINRDGRHITPLPALCILEQTGRGPGQSFLNDLSITLTSACETVRRQILMHYIVQNKIDLRCIRPRMEKSHCQAAVAEHACSKMYILCFHTNEMRPIIRSSGAILFSLLY